MSEFAIIVQNDESPWDDIKGDLYHYPETYKNILSPGCRVIYYKGKMKDIKFLQRRLSAEPHYFGLGTVGDSIRDPHSEKRDLYCEILGYQEFGAAVPFKYQGHYLETIPESKKSNYWRYGVREISERDYGKIVGLASTGGYVPELPNPNRELESFSGDGKKRERYSTYYERNPIHRSRAIEIHGLSCMCCGVNFLDRYGPWGEGFVHVHHNKPVSETGPTHDLPPVNRSTRIGASEPQWRQERCEESATRKSRLSGSSARPIPA